MKKILIFVLALVIVPTIIITSCKKDKEEPAPVNSTTYTITISGTVVDINMYPIQGVDVTVAGKNTTTDFNGNFTFTNLVVPKDRFEVTYTKLGYFTLNRSAIPTSGGQFDFQVGLISEYDFNYAGNTSFLSSAGGSLIMSNGCEITFPANAFVTSSGAAYSGNVIVKACFLDPTMTNYGMFTFGGDLHGKDSTGAVVMLNPFSGLNVVIEDGNNNSLQLDEANNKKADISMFIPTNLQFIAPNSIDLMEYDETEGMCMASGSASKNGTGDKYLGQVGHFSYWSCQKIHPGKATVKGRVTDGTNPVPGVKVHIGRLIGLNGNSDIIVVTDADGNYSAVIPSGLTGRITIPNYFGQPTLTDNIPLLANDAIYTAPDFVLTPMKKVFGKLVNCSGNPVAGGRVVLSWYSTMGYIVNAGCFTKSDGTFELQMESTVNYADIHVWGNNDEKMLSYQPVFNNPTDLGNITLCPTGPNKVTLDGGSYSSNTFTNFNVTKTGTMIYDTTGTPKHLNISVYGMYGDFYFQTDGITLGTYTIGSTATASMYISGANPPFYDSIMSGSITITKVGAENTGLIEGTFSFVSSTNVTVVGQFSVRRGPNQYN